MALKVHTAWRVSIVAITGQIDDDTGCEACMVVKGRPGHDPMTLAAHREQIKKFFFWQAWSA